jgi:hypothetical protein
MWAGRKKDGPPRDAADSSTSSGESSSEEVETVAPVVIRDSDLLCEFLS